MRDKPARAHASQDRMLGDLLAAEHPGQLIAQAAPGDAVQIEHCGVCGKTRPDRRGGVLLTPLHQFDERTPVGLVGQGCRTRFSPGDNQAVETTPPKRTERRIGAADMRHGRIAAHDLGQREEFQNDCPIRRRSTQGISKLPLGDLERGIGHVVDEADDKCVGAAAPQFGKATAIGYDGHL